MTLCNFFLLTKAGGVGEESGISNKQNNYSFLVHGCTRRAAFCDPEASALHSLGFFSLACSPSPPPGCLLLTSRFALTALLRAALELLDWLPRPKHPFITLSRAPCCPACLPQQTVSSGVGVGGGRGCLLIIKEPLAWHLAPARCSVNVCRINV